MSGAEAPSVRRVAAADVIDLRHAVLRPGRPRESARFEGDEDEGTRHFGAFRGGALVGVATLLGRPAEPAFQLRGMATLPGVRGTGHGAALVRACVEEAARAGAALLWCNARLAAAGFYQRYGFAREGEGFEIAGIGPHVRMLRRVP
jgi:predicted GNAT family N-acyltransferase